MKYEIGDEMREVILQLCNGGSLNPSTNANIRIHFGEVVRLFDNPIIDKAALPKHDSSNNGTKGKGADRVSKRSK